MESPDTDRAVLGIIGNATSLFLFLVPLTTVYKVWKSESTRRLSWLPYMTALSNCLAWLLYGITVFHRHSLSVITINGTGAVLECCYILIFFLYSRENDEKCRIIKKLGMLFISYAAAAVVTLTAFHSHERRSLFVGVLAMLCCIAMYASPLSGMRHVMEKKSVKRMPLPLSIAGLVNAVTWTAYAHIHFDLFLTISNGLGILLAIVQLILYGKYYKTTNWAEEEDDEDDSERLFRNMFQHYQQVPYQHVSYLC